METLAGGAVVQLDRTGTRGTDAARSSLPVPERRRPPRPAEAVRAASEWQRARGDVPRHRRRGIGPPAGQAAGPIPSTVSREIARNGGRDRYRAASADAAACERGRRPKQAKLAQRPALRALVEAKLALCWSPEQIAGWLRRLFPEDASM
ncbi:helix-turn-helix domain-containing protein [Streptomyces sp. NBC_00264]|nr:helix-turn-helix domain-containing protein [Streptomyces sp. ADI95-17]MCX5104304.1 helix-turn-helix domain-containing protein [Streptomyces sp. NBC_00439]MCX5164644.1 helix-turn-helix domain-containing protein [Streptomyces sp. NBC_00305]MCX5223168.1 helix-turn-helix domain-containing protein [Streptomyces sp. NBC_00264]WSC26213.1 helix-turn-helix domain-containing protein [Streptomyces sp. NBC_01768]WSG54859.1 helix-turn-helix domain-containing protein [Streptomyces sp. NBC_01732]WSP45099